MSTQLGPASMGPSDDDFYDLDEVEVVAKRKLKKPVKCADSSAAISIPCCECSSAMLCHIWFDQPVSL